MPGKGGVVQPGTPPELLNKGGKGGKAGQAPPLHGLPPPHLLKGGKGGQGWAGGFGYAVGGGWAGGGGGKAGKGKGKDPETRGGWFNRCQRLCEAVLRQDNHEAWRLVREHYAGPDPHLAGL